MATIQELESTLIKAHEAGNTEHARILANEIIRMRSEAAPAPAPAASNFKIPTAGSRYDIPGGPQVREKSPGADTMLTEMGTSAGAAMAGQMIGSFFGPGPGTIIGGGLGAGVGNLVNQLRRMAKDPEAKFSYGEMIADIGTGLIPGGPLTATGGKALAKEALKQGAGALAGAQIKAGIDEGRLLTPKEAVLATTIGAGGGATAEKIKQSSSGVKAAVAQQTAGRSTRSVTTDAGAELGLKASPTDIQKYQGGGGLVTKQAAESAGRQALDFETRIQNQAVVNQAVKKQLGLPPEPDISVKALRDVREEAGEIYNEVQLIGEEGAKRIKEMADLKKLMVKTSDPVEYAIKEAEFDQAMATTKALAELKSKADVNRLRQLRADSRLARDRYYASEGKLPAELEKSQSLREQAQDLEKEIEAAVRAVGKTDLADKLKDARTRIAQSFDVEDALNMGSSDIDARVFGRKLDQGKFLSGEMETIGKFQQTYKSAFGDPGATRPAGVSALGMLGKALVGGAAYTATQNVPAALATAFAPQIAGAATRKYLLSKGAQESAREAIRPKLTRGAPLSSVATRMVGQEVGETAAEKPVITKDAVDYLIENPDTAPDFDQMFGEGLAQRFIRYNRS